VGNSAAESNLKVGVQLRTQIIDTSGAPTDVVRTGGALRAHASNLGIISFKAQLATTAIGDGVTDCHDSLEWGVTLYLPASYGAKTEDQRDTGLKVAHPGRTVGFRTTYTVCGLMSEPGTGHYEGRPLDIFGTTA